MDFSSVDVLYAELIRRRPESFARGGGCGDGEGGGGGGGGTQKKPSTPEFKKYLKEFYAALLFHEHFNKQDNAMFCTMQVSSSIITLILFIYSFTAPSGRSQSRCTVRPPQEIPTLL